VNPRTGLVSLIVADIVSGLGSKISLVAIPWLVLVTTGSPAKMGLIAAAEMVPYMLSSVLAAPAADRFGLRRTSVLADAGSALVMAGVAATPRLGFGALVVLVMIAGGLRGIGDRVKHVMIRPLAVPTGWRLIRVTSAYDGLSRGAMLLGAPLGGLLVYWFGPTGAISFAVCALIVAVLVRQPAPETGEVAAPRESYLAALRGGFRYLRQDRTLLGMFAIVFALNVFSNASIAVFIPLWVSEVLRTPAGLGLALGAFSAGALLGNVAFTVLATRLPRYLTFALGAAISSAPRLLVLGLSDNLAIVLVVMFVSGVGIASVNPIFGVTLYERVPDALQTRVIGISGAVAFAGLPVGALLGGLAVAGLGLRPALLVAAALSLVVTLLPVLGYRPTRRPAEPTEAATVS
jgi:MFS family permease